MSLNKAYDQYKENSIYTSSPEELTLMLYNGLVKFVMQARHAIDNKDIEKAHNSIIRAEDIVVYLQSTLDMKYEISQSLMLLYDYIYRQLVNANIKKSGEILDEVLEFAKELRDTWSQAMKLAKRSGKMQDVVNK